MFPVLIEFGAFHIYSYGVLIALGGALSGAFLWTRRRRMGISREEDFWLMVNLILFGGFLGGRILYLIEYVPFTTKDMLSHAFAFNSGFSVLGAFLGVLSALYYFTRKRRIGFLGLMDYICQVAPFWHFFGRLGCLAAGCCFGRPAGEGLPWAITFDNPRSVVPSEWLGRPLHPAQLYEGFLDLILAGLLYTVVLRRIERGRLKPGTLMAAYIGAYAVLRFVMEYWRGDVVPLGMLGLTAGQGLSLGYLAAAATVMVMIYSSKPFKARR